MSTEIISIKIIVVKKTRKKSAEFFLFIYLEINKIKKERRTDGNEKDAPNKKCCNIAKMRCKSLFFPWIPVFSFYKTKRFR